MGHTGSSVGEGTGLEGDVKVGKPEDAQKPEGGKDDAVSTPEELKEEAQAREDEVAVKAGEDFVEEEVAAKDK